MSIQTPIVSRSNELYKHVRKLRDKKYRAEYGEYLAEGRRWITDARSISPSEVKFVLRAESCECDFADYVLSDALFAELSDTEHNQGMIAVMRIPEQKPIGDGDYCLFLDRVRDPGNMGTIIRTACAAGYTDIVLNDCVDIYNPKVIRSTMSGILRIKFHYLTNFEVLKDRGYTVVGTALDGENVFDAEICGNKICLVIGNEADGISERLLSVCDRAVTIPMSENIESLNAAVSAGILMYKFKYDKTITRRK